MMHNLCTEPWPCLCLRQGKGLLRLKIWSQTDLPMVAEELWISGDCSVEGQVTVLGTSDFSLDTTAIICDASEEESSCASGTSAKTVLCCRFIRC